MSFVEENVGSYKVCAFLDGQIERDVSVEIAVTPSNSPGNNKNIIIC